MSSFAELIEGTKQAGIYKRHKYLVHKNTIAN